MKVKVYEDKSDSENEFEASNISEIINKLGIDINNFIIVKNNELANIYSEIKNGDEIKFLSVISGG